MIFFVLFLGFFDEQNVFKMETFCNNVKVFTITFDQFIVPFLNKSINFFKRNETVLYTYSTNIFLC